ncbi:envelope stress response membrane protein PspC [Thalassotalea sp. LPB0316]|uniref:envelope stress response membrane protein PspC n=1 Tax=Thalassotalea sp. LPB0316 TaxID=2769490 RepID=UPI0018666C10|nr:envelope stress response membrane protein PspC [Thalassotalea sp. LPB0316]QOL27141.1 envelope stress response membrane protein PspC [Thalassotalea sp. LPB0316]
MANNRRGELFRDPKNGKVAGVCAGLADYFGWETWLVRIFAVSGVLLGAGWIILIYVAGWFILDKKPVGHVSKTVGTGASDKLQEANKEDDILDESIKVKTRIWQAGEPPKQAFYDIRRKYTKLEGQLRTIEEYVTSPQFTVSREINKL